jgi:hypothetical protein
VGKAFRIEVVVKLNEEGVNLIETVFYAVAAQGMSRISICFSIQDPERCPSHAGFGGPVNSRATNLLFRHFTFSVQLSRYYNIRMAATKTR